MRIISGKFKGHKLNIPKNFLIRPTTDRFKESLFSIINYPLIRQRSPEIKPQFLHHQ